MTEARSGPTGSARGPADWLQRVPLPVTEVPAGARFVRIHSSTQPPIFFSPGPQHPPAGRFDSATGGFGVMYLAFGFEGAFAETVLRNPARRLVSFAEIANRSLATVTFLRAVRLVRMHGPALQELGVDNAITTGPYEPCGVWAGALFAHPDHPDGIAYASRHDPEQICVALFARGGLPLTLAGESVPLTGILRDVAAVLRRYGKGLEP